MDNIVRRVVDIYQKFGAHKNLRIPSREDVIAQWGRHIDQIIHGLWPELNGAAEWPVFSSFATESGFRTPVFPFAAPVFQELNLLHLKLGVLTSSSRRGLENSLNELGSNPFLFTYASDDMPGIEKPNPKVFDKALSILREFGINPEEIFYVGDHPNDLVAARAAGLGFVAVTTGFTPREKFIQELNYPSELVLTDISELPQLIKSKRLRLTE